jgi:GntR family transcriptional regulator
VAAPNTTWQRVALDIAERIRSGETPVGSKIASHRQLTDRYGAALGTVKRAIDHLRSEGILQSAQGAGVYVVRVPEELDFAPASADEVASRITRVEQSLAEVAADEADLRKTVGELQAHLLALYDRLGQPRPGTNTKPRQDQTDRRAANG